ncbi:hypothetical protein RND71_007394 [Anisodus tanguticus]|uniref:2'-phosphotransferase n=1 Tax=Anisodus tanguticus TaxID=243964 RepID=A0AAE1VTK5_9SOLA|nr:hypothetical protein RND71_007394 [Anisodus tanguticus]
MFTSLRLVRWRLLFLPSPPLTSFLSSSMDHRPSSAFAHSNPSGGRGLDTRDNKERSGARGGGGAGSSGKDKMDALGRLLTRILRHMASELNLNMRNDGYVKVQDLLKLNLKTFANVPLKSHTVDDVKEAVRKDNKQRFGLLEENGELLIRANQGHTVKIVETESLLKPILSADEVPAEGLTETAALTTKVEVRSAYTLPFPDPTLWDFAGCGFHLWQCAVCVHGTYKKNLESILEHGLKRMKRLHVHFSCGLPTDGEVISGMRRDVNVLIFLDVRKALEDGMKLYISENRVILTEGFDGAVPVKYLQKIESWPDRKPLSL